MDNSTKPALSLVLPTYNEDEIIGRSLEEIAKTLGPELLCRTEVIIVDDGTDNMPSLIPGLAKKLRFQNLQLIRNPSPLGKGASVALGFDKAEGEIVGFMDVDLSTPPRYIHKAIEAMNSSLVDVFIASRRGAGASVNRKQSVYKDILGHLFYIAAHGIAFVGMRHYTDTQCGFKFFKNNTAKILYKNLMANDGMVDLEMLLRANLLGLNVMEFGVEWEDLRESKRRLSRIFIGEIWSLGIILLNYKLTPRRQRKRLVEGTKLR